VSFKPGPEVCYGTLVALDTTIVLATYLLRTNKHTTKHNPVQQRTNDDINDLNVDETNDMN